MSSSSNASKANGDESYKVSNLLSDKSKRYQCLYKFLKEAANELGGEQVFYILDLADILWKVQLWRKELPNVKIFYAVKANSDPVLLRLLVILGLSFDCASEGEIRLILKAGGSPENIIFAHTIKTQGGLKYARSVGVSLMTFDNEQELLKIHDTYPEARLVLRICPEDIQCLYDLSDKFGCSVKEAHQLLSLAKESNMNVVGISFHVGALCSDPKSYTSTIRNSVLLFDAAKQLGFKLTILDIGGGFFGSKGTEDIFYKVASGIKEGLKEYFPGDDVEFIAEPGCYIVGSAFTLITTILGKRNVDEHLEKGGKLTDIGRHYYINESIYGSFFRNIELYDIVLKPLLKDYDLQKRNKHKTRLFGQTCCSEDVVMQECFLPEMEIGESLVWENMGAYSQAVCSTFCSLPLPVTRYIFRKNPRLTMDWINSNKEVINFLNESVFFIEDESHAQNEML